MTFRSQAFFNESGVAGLTHRAFTAGMGYDSADMSRPLIGICTTASELNPCNSHLPALSAAVKRGVLQAGGFPLDGVVLLTNCDKTTPAYTRGYGQLYLRHVNQAPLGCDLDFLRGRTPVAAQEQPKF